MPPPIKWQLECIVCGNRVHQIRSPWFAGVRDCIDTGLEDFSPLHCLSPASLRISRIEHAEIIDHGRNLEADWGVFGTSRHLECAHRETDLSYLICIELGEIIILYAA
jgi:hypothetical protein